MKVDILNNEAINYSIILNRNLQIRLDDETEAKIEIEIFVFQDDDSNFRLDAEYTSTASLLLNKKRITSASKINDFIEEYDACNKNSYSSIISSTIKNFYKKFKNEQVKELAKEHNILL